MLKTAAMRLVELMILREDIDQVIEYLGKRGNFQLQNSHENKSDVKSDASMMLEKMQYARTYLNIEDADGLMQGIVLPSESDYTAASAFYDDVQSLQVRETEISERLKRVEGAYDEARAFSNLKVAYSELEHLTFLSLRIGKIDPAELPDITFALGDRAVIVPLGDDESRILAATPKKGRFALDSELKRHGFTPLDIPKDFTGIPDEVLASLRTQVAAVRKEAADIQEEHAHFAELHSDTLRLYLQMFFMADSVCHVKDSLESTHLVYRVTGWIPEEDTKSVMTGLDDLTEGRIAVRIYRPEEVPSVKSGREKVPVKMKHGAFVKSFERMVFSYGSPLYGTVDPTPLVAVFFTLLFGIMFGDLGQGLVFVLIGILLCNNKMQALKGWWKFGPIFVAIGCASSVMGLLTGEFFTNGNVLVPFSRWVTGLFGTPHDHILHLMPEKGAMTKLLVFFGFTLAVGFIINSVGLVINIVNQFSLGKKGRAIFGKTGICGTLFFWYAVSMALRIAFFGHAFCTTDVICMVVPLIGVFFADPLERLIEGKRPVLENGLFSSIIEGIVELLEIVSTNISSSVSFVRVGAFALSHAVLSFIIFTLTDMVGGSVSVGGLMVTVLGNVIIIVLEGMIVAIQVIRLQYYEFFSKFFTETGKEFKPFSFDYKNNK